MPILCSVAWLVAMTNTNAFSKNVGCIYPILRSPKFKNIKLKYWLRRKYRLLICEVLHLVCLITWLSYPIFLPILRWLLIELLTLNDVFIDDNSYFFDKISVFTLLFKFLFKLQKPIFKIAFRKPRNTNNAQSGNAIKKRER